MKLVMINHDANEPESPISGKVGTRVGTHIFLNYKNKKIKIKERCGVYTFICGFKSF